MSGYYIIVKSIKERKQLLDFYEPLPTVLKTKILGYFTSERPRHVCVECKGCFYEHNMTEWSHVCHKCCRYYGFALVCP